MSGSTVSFLAAGTCQIDAAQSGDSNYASGSASQTVTVVAAPAPTRTTPPSATKAQLKTPSELVRSGTGIVPIKVTCSRANCGGSLSLELVKSTKIRSGKKTVTKQKVTVYGSKSFSLKKGKSETVTLTLGAAGRAGHEHGGEAPSLPHSRGQSPWLVEHEAECSADVIAWSSVRAPRR